MASAQIETDSAQIDWGELHALLMDAYAYMADRIDPPSSLLAMSAADLEQKATKEQLVIASSDSQLVGCLFCRPSDGWLYVGKVAVAASYRGLGLATRMFDRARAIARAQQLLGLELETRIELTENHRTFVQLGFHKVADQSHPGYDEVTSIRMRAPLA